MVITSASIQGSMYPEWDGYHAEIPSWAVRAGLLKYNPIVRSIGATAALWKRAEADGIPQIAPALVLFAKPPDQIKADVGGEIWRRMHHAKISANVDRLVLRLIGGWTLDEAMEWPAWRRAKPCISSHGKSALLWACRNSATKGDFSDNLQLARDFQRMGGVVDPAWGMKRMRREHDAKAVQFAMRSANPEPWAKPWFCDVGPYSFSLLKSELELALEGATQRHCARSYALACRDGREVVLRIEGPERATCSWRVGERYIQVKAACNKPVMDETEVAAAEARRLFEARGRSA